MTKVQQLYYYILTYHHIGGGIDGFAHTRTPRAYVLAHLCTVRYTFYILHSPHTSTRATLNMTPQPTLVLCS